MQIFADNMATFMRYAGAGFLFALYVPAMVWLLFKEKEGWKRIVLCYAPLIVLAVFFLPPATLLYRAVIGDDGANYRLLWMVPFGITITYAGIKAFAAHRRVGLFTLAVLVIISGRAVYRSVHVSRAQNAYHLPQIVIDIADRILAEEEGRALCCFPPEMVHQVRQYDTRILLTYGRASVEPSMHLYNATYEAVAVPEKITMKEADDALESAAVTWLQDHYEEEGALYLVLHKSRRIDRSPERSGWEVIDELHDYRIYRKTFTVPKEDAP